MQFAIIALSVLALPGVASAQDWYVAARAGSTVGGHYVRDPDLTNEATIGGAIGRSWGPLRLELGATQVNGDRVTAPDFIDEIEYLDAAFTLYGDLPVSDRLSLFAGVGADYLSGSYDGFNGTFGYDFHGEGLHWSAGAAYRLTDRITSEIQYTRLEADVERDNRGSAQLDLNGAWVSLGARFAF